MDENEILEKVLKGEVKLYEIDELAKDSNIAAHIRRQYLEKKFGKQLQKIGAGVIDFNHAINRNIENPIGAVQVPLGYAGELKINGTYADGSYPILLATTEGRLVAGIARGISGCNKAGVINTAVVKDGMTRDVLIRTGSVKESEKLIKWINSKAGLEFIRAAFEGSTKHGKLVEVKPYTTGRDVHVRFKATTGAAMGMNMVTIASKAAMEAIIQEVKSAGINAVILSESGNMCSDKKPAFINMLEGRGASVIAEIVIPRQVLEEKFKVAPEAVVELNRVKNLMGSALAGSHGYNAHVANILAAMYLANGQDLAQVVEGAQAMTEVSLKDGDLYISCTLPAIEVGTYGGGTARETQREALGLLGLNGDSDHEGRTRLILAEIIAATCLVGELNLLSIQAAGELSKSHAGIKRG